MLRASMATSRLKFPHPLIIILGCILLAGALTWIIPAGKYNEVKKVFPDGKEKTVVLDGTFHHLPKKPFVDGTFRWDSHKPFYSLGKIFYQLLFALPDEEKTEQAQPVSLFAALVAIPKAMADPTQAAPVIIYVFLVGGAFAVIERTGALRKMVDAVTSLPPSLRKLVIPVGCLVFGMGGALVQMQEELLAFVPMLLLLSRRMGYNRLTVVAMSMGAAAVGASFSHVNPFQVVIAQKIADIPPTSGANFRLIFLAAAFAIWMIMLSRYAEKTRGIPEQVDIPKEGKAWQHITILLMVVGTFALFLASTRFQNAWDFPQWSALFFIMGLLAGLIGGLGLNGTAEAFIEGIKAMGFAALIIGFTKAISLVMEQGTIKHTIIHALAEPLSKLPLTLSAVGMMGLQTLLHFPVSSTSGQAAMTLPILGPVAKLVGLTPQIAVLAYQYGAGLCELITPTNGALMAMIAAAGVGYKDWLRWLLKTYALLVALAIIALIVAVSIHLQ